MNYSVIWVICRKKDINMKWNTMKQLKKKTEQIEQGNCRDKKECPMKGGNRRHDNVIYEAKIKTETEYNI